MCYKKKLHSAAKTKQKKKYFFFFWMKKIKWKHNKETRWTIPRAVLIIFRLADVAKAIFPCCKAIRTPKCPYDRRQRPRFSTTVLFFPRLQRTFFCSFIMQQQQQQGYQIKKKKLKEKHRKSIYAEPSFQIFFCSCSSLCILWVLSHRRCGRLFYKVCGCGRCERWNPI